MRLQLRNMTTQWMLAAMLALSSLVLGLGQTIQNPASGGYQLFGQGASEISVSNPLNALENFTQSPENAPDYANAPNRTPQITIRDHYDHHNAMRADVIDQLEGQGFRVSPGEASFGSSCGVGRCRPDIIYRTPDGQVRIIEIKTGNADLSIRQTDIFPQIENGNAIPRGRVAERFGLDPGIPLKDQGYPNGIPIEVQNFPGAG